MAKKKLNLAYISDDKARKATFKHRKRGLIKKLDELKILCDVDAYAVIYNPFNSSPEVWPSNWGVYNFMQKFEMLTETQKTYRSVDHNEFLNQYIKKVEKQNQKLIEGNKEKLMRELMFGCLGGNLVDLAMNDNIRRHLCEFIDQYLKNLFHHKSVTLNNPHFEIGESSSMAMATDMSPIAMAEAGSSSFWNASIFNSPQLTNESQSIITSNHEQEHISSHGNQFLNVPIFNFPQQTNELQSTISSNQGLEQVLSLGSNFMSAPIFNSPQLTNEMQQPTISSNQGSEHVDSLASNLLPISDHEVNTPVMNQDEVYYPPNQNQNQQVWYVEEMMKHFEQTGFPWMEENHHYNHHQF